MTVSHRTCDGFPVVLWRFPGGPVTVSRWPCDGSRVALRRLPGGPLAVSQRACDGSPVAPWRLPGGPAAVPRRPHGGSPAALWRLPGGMGRLPALLVAASRCQPTRSLRNLDLCGKGFLWFFMLPGSSTFPGPTLQGTETAALERGRCRTDTRSGGFAALSRSIRAYSRHVQQKEKMLRRRTAAT